jgi:hypothetical protein
VLIPHLPLASFGRLEFETSIGPASARPVVLGALFGVEGWGAAGVGGGGALPLSLYIGGHRDRGFWLTGGLGTDLVLYDRAYDQGGFGIFAPLVTTATGVDLGAIRILLDARGQYRWNFSAPNRLLLGLGLTLSVNNG